jgi:hypothetical protein
MHGELHNDAWCAIPDSFVDKPAPLSTNDTHCASRPSSTNEAEPPVPVPMQFDSEGEVKVAAFCRQHKRPTGLPKDPGNPQKATP